VIEHVGDILRLRFDRWDAESYALFLRTKTLPEHAVLYDEATDAYTVEAPARFAGLLGFQLPATDRGWAAMPAHLFDYQVFFTRVALEAKRYAVWADTGLGKTPIELEWARQVHHRTGGKVLMVYLLNLIPQVLEMAEVFYPGGSLALQVLATREEMVEWCRTGRGIALVNPEKFIPRDGQELIPEITHCAGVAIDESSLLKTGGGAIKWALIKSCRGVEYKLSCTATPAPNDPIEYASQASWLEKIRDEGEVIWTYFIRDSEGEWKVKDHALPAFYRFLSGWSCYVRQPARYGFGDNLKDLPAPQRFEHAIPVTRQQHAYLSKIPDAQGQTSIVEPTKQDLVARTKLAQLSSGFVYQKDCKARRVASGKPGFIADLVRRELAEGLQVLVWTQFDETAEILDELLLDLAPGIETLTGGVPLISRPGIIDRFKAGETRALITRPRLLGFGTNLQCCGSMVFADLNDSYEQVYQAERRAFRYGQTRSVRFHFPIVPELQGAVWQNLERKRSTFERDVARMERLYVEAMRDQLPPGAAA
jgi:hypothetical protein